MATIRVLTPDPPEPKVVLPDFVLAGGSIIDPVLFDVVSTKEDGSVTLRYRGQWAVRVTNLRYKDHVEKSPFVYPLAPDTTFTLPPWKPKS